MAKRSKGRFNSRREELPLDRLPIPKEAAGGTGGCERGRPYDPSRPFFDTPVGALSSHIGPHPTRADGVHSRPDLRQLSRRYEQELSLSRLSPRVAGLRGFQLCL